MEFEGQQYQLFETAEWDYRENYLDGSYAEYWIAPAERLSDGIKGNIIWQFDKDEIAHADDCGDDGELPWHKIYNFRPEKYSD